MSGRHDREDVTRYPQLLRRLTNSKRPKNKPEGLFHDWAIQQGYLITKRGWPDFFIAIKNSGQIALIEVKPHNGRCLSRHQSVVMLALAAFGVPCFRWSPETGFTRIGIRHPHKDTVENVGENNDK